MTRFLKYLGKRVLIMIPQMLGITLVSFLLVRLLPGNPATAMAGSLATPETVAAIEARLGLDQPLYIQFYMYVKNVLAGDLGTSWYTSNPVANDLAVRFPATLELITLSMFFAILVGVVGGSIAAIKPKGLVDRVTSGFATFAGAMPEFWIGLIFIYVFYVRLGIAAAPIGRLDLQFSSPPQVTGMILIDTLLTGNMAMFQSAVSHLILPVLTLSITLVGPILKMSRTSMRNALDSDYIYYAHVWHEAKAYRRVFFPHGAAAHRDHHCGILWLYAGRRSTGGKGVRVGRFRPVRGAVGHQQRLFRHPGIFDAGRNVFAHHLSGGGYYLYDR